MVEITYIGLKKSQRHEKNLSFLADFPIFLTFAVSPASRDPFFRIPDDFLRQYRLFHRILLMKMTCINANMSKKTGKKPLPPPPSKGGQEKYGANWNSIVQWSVMSARLLGTHIHSGNTGLGIWKLRMTFAGRLIYMSFDYF